MAAFAERKVSKVCPHLYYSTHFLRFRFLHSRDLTVDMQLVGLDSASYLDVSYYTKKHYRLFFRNTIFICDINMWNNLGNANLQSGPGMIMPGSFLRARPPRLFYRKQEKLGIAARLRRMCYVTTHRNFAVAKQWQKGRVCENSVNIFILLDTVNVQNVQEVPRRRIFTR
jgi:hypothetical protein